MRAHILETIAWLEEEMNVKVLHAIESGSRAWGFASPDSDWDVRFIYVHEPDWYLSVQEGTDYVNRMLPRDLDFSGWELRKALRLFRKFNPALIEHLHSPITYVERGWLAEELRAMSRTYFNPIASCYHYYHMAAGNFKDLAGKEEIRLKKYLYVVRPVLASYWILERKSPPPVAFETLVEGTVREGALQGALAELVERKMSLPEIGEGKLIPVIHDFLETSLEDISGKLSTLTFPNSMPLEEVDELFRSVLAESWT